MVQYQVYVVSQTGTPLMPTRRFGKVRRLLKSGRAKVICRKPFTIMLLYNTSEYTQALMLGIDPGAKEIGLAVRKENGELVYAGKVQTRSGQVSENMEERAMHRRSRRRHRRLRRQRRARKAGTCFEEKKYKIAGTETELVCKAIKPKPVRFNNRVREDGWLTPTARHLLETHKNAIEKVGEILPIKTAGLEYGKFNLHKLQNPQIGGKKYQEGRMKGYVNAHEYVLCRDRHTCRLCEKGDCLLQTHHVIWASEGGADTPENLVTLCEKCHTRVHKNAKTEAKVKELFAGMVKRYVHTTLLNTIMPSLHRWLAERFSEVTLTYGYETKAKRRELGLPKEHHIDAYLITLEEAKQAAGIDWDRVCVYRYSQFRRHHRQLIHATRDRNYKVGKKIVAKNRRKRTGQQQDSLSEWIKKQGKRTLSRLRMLPGKKVIRSGFGSFRKGDTVSYKGKKLVVKGYGQMGRTLGFVGEDRYVPAKDCRLLVRSKGMVCL